MLKSHRRAAKLNHKSKTHQITTARPCGFLEKALNHKSKTHQITTAGLTGSEDVD